MAHKTVATKEGGINVELSPQEILDSNADKEKRSAKAQSIAWKGQRAEAYEDELGSVWDQIDYMCENGLEAMATKRQDIKLRYPKPV